MWTLSIYQTRKISICNRQIARCWDSALIMAVWKINTNIWCYFTKSKCVYSLFKAYPTFVPLSNSLLQVSVRAHSVGGMEECRSLSSKGTGRAGGPHVCAVVGGGAPKQCHGNMGSALICPHMTSCGRSGTVLAGILGGRTACDANKPVLFAGPRYIFWNARNTHTHTQRNTCTLFTLFYFYIFACL